MRSSVFVAGHFPRGSDRIAAYKLAQTFSAKWISSLKTSDQESRDKAETGSKKIETLLQTSEIELLLEENGLKDFDKYATKPTILISQLLSRKPATGIAPGVYHSVAEELATRFKIDLEKLKLMILQRLLMSEDKFVIRKLTRMMISNSRYYSYYMVKLSGASRI